MFQGILHAISQYHNCMLHEYNWQWFFAKKCALVGIWACPFPTLGLQTCSILLLTLKKCIFFSRVQFTNMKDILGIVFGHKSIYIGRQGMNLTLIQFYRQYTLGGIHILENVALLFPELHTHCLNRQVPHDIKFCVLKLEDDLNFWLGSLEVIEILQNWS